MAKEVKKSNSKTNKTATTVTVTVETKKEYAPSYKMPINKGDRGTEIYYKQHEGVKVATVHGTGRMQTFAYIPDEDYENATDEEKAAIKQKTESFSRQADNMRRTESRKTARIKEHEVASLDGLMDSGYDPSIDSIDVAIKITETMAETDALKNEFENEDFGTSTANNEDEELAPYMSDEDYDDFFNGTDSTKSRGGYNAENDDSNPETIFIKNERYAKLHEFLRTCEGEKREIIKMVLDEMSVEKKANQLGVPKSTLNDHKNDLFAEMREFLKDYM